MIGFKIGWLPQPALLTSQLLRLPTWSGIELAHRAISPLQMAVFTHITHVYIHTYTHSFMPHCKPHVVACVCCCIENGLIATLLNGNCNVFACCNCLPDCPPDCPTTISVNLLACLPIYRLTASQLLITNSY